MQCECLLIGLDDTSWANTVKQDYLNLKIVLHNQTGNHTSPITALNDPNLLHGRYDAALIYVNPATISIWRAALANMAKSLPSPLIIYAASLKSQSIKDFLQLGVSDFIIPPFNSDEFRTRIENAALRKNTHIVAENVKNYNHKQNHKPPEPAKLPTSAQNLCASILERSGTELEAYAVALATQKATDRATFKAAKNEIISHFEQAYIKASLDRYCGNVTMAARMAQKHRRAFWALMKKHNIDPNPYRIN